MSALCQIRQNWTCRETGRASRYAGGEEVAMSAVLEAPAKAKITPEEMLLLPDKGRGYELVDGELKERAVSFLATYVAGRILNRLSNYVEAGNLGWVTSEGTSYRCFPDDVDKVRRVDAAFHRLARVSAAQAITEGHFSVVPDLVVEVLSPNDLVYEVRAKLGEWLAAGARLVWLVYPVDQVIQVYKADGAMTELGRNDTLTGVPVLPDFKVIVGELFKLPTD
jgi:Uma2 family endonuclease